MNLSTLLYYTWDPSKGIEIGSFTLHYYSLMFVLAFGIGYYLFVKMFKIDHESDKNLDTIFTWTLLGTILGARLGHVFFYEPELIKTDFWAVFLPIQTIPEFKFTGFSGLASHGAAIVLVCTTICLAIKVLKKNPLWLLDRLAITVALAGFFIRFGNFFNSEIIGKPAPDKWYAVKFPQQSISYGEIVPRYPTQLFEAFSYLALFFVMWFIYLYTKKKYNQGWLFGFFFAVLWSIRFLVEFLKEQKKKKKITLGILNTGQVLSIPLVIIGILVMLYSKNFKYEDKITS